MSFQGTQGCHCLWHSCWCMSCFSSGEEKILSVTSFSWAFARIISLHDHLQCFALCFYILSPWLLSTPLLGLPASLVPAVIIPISSFSGASFLRFFHFQILTPCGCLCVPDWHSKMLPCWSVTLFICPNIYIYIKQKMYMPIITKNYLTYIHYTNPTSQWIENKVFALVQNPPRMDPSIFSGLIFLL